MTAEELLERYAAGERDFSRVDLEGADLRGVELPRITLIEANLRNADLSGAFFYYTIMPDGTTLIGPEYGR